VSELVDRYLRPREGWITWLLLLVMVLSLGWSVQRAEWLLRAEFLIPIGFYAVVGGVLLALTRWSVVVTLTVAAVVGAGLSLWAVGGEYYPEATQAERLFALRDEAITWLRILVDRGYPPQETPYAIGLALLMWVTAFIATYTIYRHHRVLDGILLLGALLIANMSASLTDLFIYLILFVLAALLLWLRTALLSREEGWVRRRVTENADVPSAIMRSGIIFIAASITLAWTLTSVAVAAPLTGLWNNLDGMWGGVQDNLEALVGGFSNADSRIGGTSFGPSRPISGSWVSSDTEILTITSPSGRGHYLRTIAYDVYTGHGWDQSDRQQREVPAGERFYPDYTAERPIFQDAFEAETVVIVLHDSPGRSLFAPGFPYRASAPVVLDEIGGVPLFAALDAGSSLSAGDGYTITAMISQATRAQLSAAGSDYPPEIRAMYLGTEGVTDATRQKAAEVAAEAGAVTPYEQAAALARWLNTGEEFTYATQASLPSDPDRDFVDFFLFDEEGRVGYCEYYASAMVVMARTLGIPARMASGYAPGERVDQGQFLVRASNAHAWAELYFPGYGWQIFEATKSIAGVVRRAGEPLPDASGGPRASVPPLFNEGSDEGLVPQNIPSFQPLPGGGTLPGAEVPAGDTRGGNALVIIGIVGIVLAIAIWRLRRSSRTWRFMAPGERQWQRLALAAGRAGVAQRPSETIYEYAGWLEEQIPARRPEIRTVAGGKVWQSYSGRGMTADAIAGIERAWARLEWPLIWLTIRRRLRSLIPRR